MKPLVIAAVLLAGAPGADDAAVRAAVREYVDALNALDLERMMACFTEDATAYVPTAQAERVAGSAALREVFRAFIERTRRTTSRLAIAPQDLRVEVSGDLGVATFHVAGAASHNRRTFVFRRGGGRWLISHFHGSDFPARPQ